MQSDDDDLQTTLSKWPFILGDVLLVVTALAIAILGDWQLTNMQVASCVISVALGCGLFVLPYIVEYQVRVREQVEDRSADLRVIKRHLVAAGEEFDLISRRIKSLEHSLEDLAQAKPDLTVPMQALEGKLDPLQAQQAEQSTQLSALTQGMESLRNSVQTFETNAGKLDPLQSLQAEQSTQLDALLQQVESLQQSLQTKAELNTIEALQAEFSALQAQVEAIPAAPVAAAQADPVSESAANEESSAADEVSVKKVRSTRTRRGSEPRLLQRAIEQKQDRSSQAVSRIIEFRSKKSAAVVEAAGTEQSRVEEPATEATVEPVPEPAAAVDALAVAENDGATESKETKEPEVELEPAVDAEEESEAARSESELDSKDQPVAVASSGSEENADDSEQASEGAEVAESELEPAVDAEEESEAARSESELDSKDQPVAVASSGSEENADDSEQASEGAEVAESELEPAVDAEEESEAARSESELDSKDQPVAVASSGSEENADDSEQASEGTEAVHVSSGAVAMEARKPNRTKKSDTAVIASVFIGIGNKPFVRGSGLGLNWDKGVEMDFEEIGKWRWLASADLAEPIEIQIFRNDEDPDAGGKYRLEPGQQLELSPVF